MSDTPRTDAAINASVGERGVYEELERMTALARALELEIRALKADKERLDWLESQAGGGWVARHSTRGRGYRLHQDPSNNPGVTARAAIDAARAQ